MRRKPKRGKPACDACEGARKVECEDCDGTGETAGDHVGNCDVGPEGGCAECLGNEDCVECEGSGEVSCPDCGDDDES